MIVVAVKNLDVHARVGHSPGEPSQLSGNRLLEALNDDIAPIDNTGAATLHAHTRAPERFTHLGECSGAVVDCRWF